MGIKATYQGKSLLPGLGGALFNNKKPSMLGGMTGTSIGNEAMRKSILGKLM